MMIKKRKIELYDLLKKYIGYNTPDKEDLVHSIYEVFLRRKYIEKYDPEKSSFTTFVNNYYKFILGNMNRQRKYLNTVELKEGFNDIDNISFIEDFIKKESLTEIFDYFTEEEIDLMSGVISGADVGRKKNVSRQTVNEKLRKRIKEFRENL